ncbi:S41 family peptidase [Croceitalea marina]|uniref:S41 family peptidase n=1 Tax=Croceitalea marina TaxID=1775166 RepID=A0ABW5MYE9_9FLAO
MKILLRLDSLLIAILLCGAVLQCSSQESRVSFLLKKAPDVKGYRLGIRGSQEPLSWDKTIFLENNSIEIDFSKSDEILEYKYVLDSGTDVKWEGIQNRDLQFNNASLSVKDIWNKETPVDITSIKDISSKELLEDYKLLEEMVLNVHPGTYRYRTEAEIMGLLEELKLAFKDSLSVGEAYLVMSKVTASIQCDHTMVSFYNQNKYVNTVIHEQSDKLPFTFKWFDGRMIIDMSASNGQDLKRGVEVLRINDAPVSKILSSLLPYVAADGATDKNRIRKLEIDGFDFRYNAFDVFYPLKYITNDNKYKLRIIVNGTEKEVVVNGIHREERAEILKNKYPNFPQTSDDMWRFEVKDNIGILTLNSYNLMGWKSMTIDYKKFLSNAFLSLKNKNVKNLIIDIRKNEGGIDEMKDELFSYLPFDRTSVKLFPREGRTRFLHFPNSLKPYVKTWEENPWYYNLKEESKEGIYYVFYEDIKKRLPLLSKEAVFKGNVILLTGSINSSLAFYTARDFRQYKIGRSIGEETGGNRNEINGGPILFLTLPNSGIEIDFPIMGAFSKQRLPNTGIIPDYVIRESIEQFKNDHDVVMKKASELIETDYAGN